MQPRAVAVGTLAVVGLLAGCSSSASHTPTGPVPLKSEIQFRSLTKLPTACAPGQGARLTSLPEPSQPIGAADRIGQQCYALGPAIAVVDTAAAIALNPPSVQGSPWTILLSFQPAQQAQITAYTSAHHSGTVGSSTPDPTPADYLVTLADGYVVEAPSMEDTINGSLQIIAGTTKDEADALYKTLTGN